MSEKKQINAYLLLGFLALTWGSSYILIKKSLLAFDPIEVAILRMTVASMILTPFAIRAIKRVPRKLWKYLIFPGWIGAAIPAVLFAYAQTNISSSLAGILGSATPIITMVLGFMFFSLRVNVFKVVGILLGFFGTFTLVACGNGGASGSTIPALMIVVATIGYALSTNAVHKWLQGVKSMDITSLSFAMILPVALGLTLTLDLSGMMQRDHFVTSIVSLLTLSLFGTVMASVLYFRLVQISGALFASMVSYLIPLVALLWGLVDGEHFYLVFVLGMALILGGVYLTRHGTRIEKAKLK